MSVFKPRNNHTTGVLSYERLPHYSYVAWRFAIAIVLVWAVVGSNHLYAASGGMLGEVTRPSDEEIDKLRNGSIITDYRYTTSANGEKLGFARSTIWIKAPAKSVWRELLDTEYYDEFMPRLIETREIARDGLKIDTQHLLDFSVSDIRYTVNQQFYPEKNKFLFELDKSREHGIFRDVEGCWSVYTVEGGYSVLVYHFRMQVEIPGLAWIINPILDAMAESTLPDVVSAVKKRVENKGAWKKTDAEAVNPPRLPNRTIVPIADE